MRRLCRVGHDTSVCSHRSPVPIKDGGQDPKWEAFSAAQTAERDKVTRKDVIRNMDASSKPDNMNGAIFRQCMAVVRQKASVLFHPTQSVFKIVLQNSNSPTNLSTYP